VIGVSHSALKLGEKIQQLAQQHNQSVNEKVIFILKQAVKETQIPLKFLISPETDPILLGRKDAKPLRKS
jgi:hypothetical protein